MPDNVKTALSISLLRLLRPLVRIMLREGLTYSHFAAIAQMAFVESAAKDFVGKGMKSSATSVCALTGMTVPEVQAVLIEQERFERLREVGVRSFRDHFDPRDLMRALGAC